jgi:hypothetical protein
MTSKKIPDSNIVKGSKRVLPKGHPLTKIYDPNSFIEVGETSEYSGIGAAFPVGLGSFITGSSSGAEEAVVAPKGPSGPAVVVDDKDVIDLANIESCVVTKYFDPVTKVEKAKAVLKIRNTSKFKANVSGIDARVSPEAL